MPTHTYTYKWCTHNVYAHNNQTKNREPYIATHTTSIRQLKVKIYKS